MNTILTNLLNDNKNILRALHACIGFNFAANMNVFEIENKFTLNQVYKIATAAGHNCTNSTIAILTKAGSGFYDKYHTTILSSSTSINIDINHCGYNNNKFVSLDTFNSKKSFEETRKSAAHTVVICQFKEFMQAPQRDYKKPDFNERFKLSKFDYIGFMNSSEKAIYKLDLILNNGSVYTLNHDYRLFKTMDISLLIDKSGYLLFDRHENLRRRAAAIRAQKEKEAYNKKYNDVTIKDIAKQIEAKRLEIIAELTIASSSEQVQKISKKLDYYRGLSGIMSDFELLKARENKKEYCSIAQFDNAANHIIEKLSNL